MKYQVNVVVFIVDNIYQHGFPIGTPVIIKEVREDAYLVKSETSDVPIFEDYFKDENGEITGLDSELLHASNFGVWVVDDNEVTKVTYY